MYEFILRILRVMDMYEFMNSKVVVKTEKE